MAMNRRLHDFSLAQETMPFGFRNRFIAFAFLCFCGCAFPKEQTRYKAKVLKEQGQNAAAQRLEAQAESQPDLIIGTTPSEYSPREDPYHFPDHYVPPEKRHYAIQLSTTALPSVRTSSQTATSGEATDRK